MVILVDNIDDDISGTVRWGLWCDVAHDMSITACRPCDEAVRVASDQFSWDEDCACLCKTKKKLINNLNK